MKISLNWLKSYINFSLTTSVLGDLLTQRGLEVAHVRSTIKGGLEGLVIGDILSCIVHPNADRLHVALVDIGLDKPLSIVCGAPNVQAGIKVVVAPVGVAIYSYLDQAPFLIKKVKIRGVWSEGMICAEDEIGLGPAHDHILVLSTALPAGTTVKDYFREELDEILEIEITPNRADACSHIGVARELKAILHLPITLPSITSFSAVRCPALLKVTVVDSLLCPRYCGLLLNNVRVQPSPRWLCNRLERIGVKPINNVVDVTNFVLHELGQPLHAFDYNAIIGKELMVQHQPAGTLFKGLDGVERKLAGHELMICDIEGPIAMAGVLGGLKTSVTDATQDVFLESAYFDPASIRSASQYHSLKTDASFRFERGTDPNMLVYALKRAALLLQEFSTSAKACEIIESYSTELAHFTIPISYKKITHVLGTVISPARVRQIVTDLEIGIEDETDEGFTARVPPYRVDVIREIDLIEEIVRIYGYDAIPITGRVSTTYWAPESSVGNAYKVEQEVSKMLVANGCYEIWTNSLTKEAYVDLLNGTELAQQEILILNPLSTATNRLRATLLFSGLEVIAYNLAHRQCDLKLFEFGTVYRQDDISCREEKRLAIWLIGQIEHQNWVRQLGPVTLQSLRRIIEHLVQKLGIADLSYEEVMHPFYEQAAQVTHQGVVVMVFGQVKASILGYFAVEQPVFFADINWRYLLEIRKLHLLYKPISKFPAVKRDLSLVMDKTILFQQVKDLVAQQAYKNVEEMYLIDVYEGANLPVDKKSYMIRFILRDRKKTLDDKNIDQIMNQLIQTFERDLNAIIRR